MNDFDCVGITPEQFRKYLPGACKSALEQERFILERGIPLTDAQCSDAKGVGVVHPERVRLMRVEQIPVPNQPLLRAVAQAVKLNTPQAPSLALRYGIFIRSEYWGQRWPVVHELAHIAQFERLGSIWAFTECFLYQCLVVGYPSAPMEQEAIAMAQRICGPPPALNMPHTALPTNPTGKPPVNSRGTRK